MVTIQPFEYEKTTAFKERVQIANKVNEIISLFNELDIESKINIFNEEIAIINGKITEINNALNEVNTAVNTVEGYNARLTSVENESISLDARLDNIEPVVSSNTAKIGVLENKDLENVKLSGNQTIENIKTFSNSPIVPNPPSGDTSTKAVNTNWISQTGDNAPNNLMHKISDETFLGIKTAITGIDGKIYYHSINTILSTDNAIAKGFSLNLMNNQIIIVDIVSAYNNEDTQNATIKIFRRDSDNVLGCVVLNSVGTTSSMASGSNYIAVLDGDVMTFYTKKIRRYTTLKGRVWWVSSYGNMIDLPKITWINELSEDPTTEIHDRIAIGSIVEYHNVA